VSEKRIELKILGITFSQVQAGAYALILVEENGIRRVPIIIGTPEAQSIAIYLEGLIPPRPLTHDLFISFTDVINVKLKGVNIYKYEDGVFFSELLFDNQGQEVRIDSRTSDAIAIAIRVNAPIYTTEAIMREVGVEMKDDDFLEEIDNESVPLKENLSYDKMNLEDLRKILNEAIIAEDYEKASSLRDLINKKLS
jgi:bifunctional DNase/RNase